MKIVIQQPEYMPWSVRMSQYLQCDVLVVYDTAQYVKHDFGNRNRIRVGDSWKWLTVPVVAHGFPAFKDVQIASKSWARTHLETIRHSYSKAPHFQDVFPCVEDVLRHDWSMLLDLQLAVLKMHFELLNVRPSIVCFSDLDIKSTERVEKLIEVCQMFGASTYLSGASAASYLDVDKFAASGLTVEFAATKNPVYLQAGNGFMPQMCALDMLMNCGAIWSREMLLNPRPGLPVVKSPALINARN
jgi:hypothetical protein